MRATLLRPRLHAIVHPGVRPFTRVLGGAMDELLPDPLRAAADWTPDAPDAYCPRCGASAGPGAVTARGCPFCLDTRPPWHRLTRLGVYSSPLAEGIRAMKFHSQWRWAPWLGEHLARAVGEPFDAERVVVCPVPMHWFRKWRRGYNQAALMAQTLADARGWLMAEVLRRTRHTPPQTTVPHSRRAANIRGSFDLIRVDLTGYEVVLIDDVKTTGATLSNCAHLLRRAGARAVHAAVAAVADPRSQDFSTI